MTGDRGLAGAFNSQVLRRAFALGRELEAEGQTIRWLVAGKKGRSTLRFRGYEVASDWTGFSDRPAYTDAQAIAHTLTEQYVDGEFDRVILVYNHFDSPLVQKVTEQEVLPIPEHLLETDDDERRDDAMRGDFIYEPEPEEILARLLAGLPRDGALPRAARVGGLRAGRPDDRDAERLEERRRADRQPHARDEPGPAGRDHPGDPGSRGRRRRAGGVAANILG